MVLKSFNAIKEKNKVLICNNMRVELQLDFPGRVRLRKWFDVQKFFVQRFKNKYKPPHYIFDYKTISGEELSLRISAADVVMVPRIDILNSGNVFLGFTFGKVTVGPATGNIKEQLLEQNCPIFDPNSLTSAASALKEGVKMSRIAGIEGGKSLLKYLPENISAQYDQLFLRISNE